MRGGCGFRFGNGCSDGSQRGQPVRRREAPHHPHQGRVGMQGCCTSDEKQPTHPARAGAAAGLSRRGAARPAAGAGRRASTPSGAAARPASPNSRACVAEMQRGRPAGASRPLRRAVRPRPRHLAAPVRARARRLARPRPGDDGPAQDLRERRPAAGAHELPDHLCVVLEFASTQPPRVARDFLGEMAHILNAIFSALRKRESRYASVLAARAGAGRPQGRGGAACADDEPLDESWAEPVAFDGCSTAGQAAPGQPQPIHIVRRTGAPPPRSTHELPRPTSSSATTRTSA